MTQKVIIDTDIGDDIDDAFAIYLAMKSPELDILGITTVFKHTYKRAQIVSRMLKTEGMSDIPVVPGIGRPIVGDSVHGRPIDFEEKPFQYLDDMEDEIVNTSVSAVQFMAETIMRSSQPVTIITLGALTNVAVMLLSHPQVAINIEKIVMMGGAYDLHLNEYNISCDPEAAKIVVTSGVKIVAVGLDVTFRCVLSEDDVDRILKQNGSLPNLIGRMRKFWPSPLIYLHDPLAIAVAFQEDFVKLEQRKIDIELKGEYSRGMIVNLSDMNWQHDPSESNVWVCTEVDHDRFVKFYVDRVAG